ncbi:MAG: GNAT family N-acetyltransferase [Stappiaceae bacterium]
MTIVIRKAERTDFEMLFTISRRTIVDNFSSFLESETLQNWISKDSMEQYFSDNLDNCRTIETQGILAGFCVSKGKTIDLLLIDNRQQRRGLGAMLLGYVERELFRLDPELTTDSFVANQKADAFFLATGWRAGEEFEDTLTSRRKRRYSKIKPADQEEDFQ